MGINGLRDAAQTRNINLTRYRPLSELTNRRRLRQMLRGHDRYGPMSPDEITAEMERRGHSVAPVGNLEDPENPDNQEIRENRGRLQEVLVQLDNGAEANLSRPVRNMLARRRAIFKEISKDQKKLPATRVSRSPPASRPTTRSSSRSTRLTPPPIDTSVDKMPNNAPSQPASDGPSPPPQGDGDGNEPAGGHDTEDDPGSDHASETSGDGPDTAHDEAIARALQDKSQTPEAAKTEEEKERKRKQDEEDERRRKATRSRNRKRAKQLRQEHRFDAAAGLPGPLRQLEVTGDGHCLYRAFGVAYYGSENIARGVRDEHSEDQYCLYVRGRLRRWWNKVTRERTSEESRSRLEYYRALNAMSAREGTQTRDRMQTYIHALETNSEAILGYSPTLEEDTDRGVETLAWQINSLDDDNVGGTFETVQVLADAFDVEIIIHVPRLNGGHPPEIEDWETFARGRQGAQQIHLIQWMDGLHWTAAMPAEEGIDWASVIAEDARLPIAHSGFPLIETTVPPELPVAIRYTGLDSAADRPSAPSSGSANSIAGRRGSSRKRPSPEVGSSEVRQLKQPKTTQPRIHDTAPPLRDARADHQVQPPKTSSEGPRGNRKSISSSLVTPDYPLH